MQNEIEAMKISQLIDHIYPFIIQFTKKIIESEGFSIKEKGEGLEQVFTITGGKCIDKLDFSFYNLLLEIATIDRDDIPLRFDDRLLDNCYLVKKAAKITSIRLRTIFANLEAENLGEIADFLKEIYSEGDLERICLRGPEQGKDRLNNNSYGCL